MSRREEMIDLFGQAIDAHQRNIAKTEIRKADLGLAAPDILDEEIERSYAEIDRLEKMREKSKSNGKGRVTNGERLDLISAQISTLGGEVSMMHYDMKDIKSVVTELRDGCPLFNPDTPEGPLEFVRKT